MHLAAFTDTYDNDNQNVYTPLNCKAANDQQHSVQIKILTST